MRVQAAVFIAGCVGAVTLAAAALQTPPQAPSRPPSQKPPVFTSRVDLVQLDVEVLDKDHVPVRGLTLDDFILKEDGKPQKVVALNEVDLDAPAPPPVAWMRDVTPDVTTNALDPTARLTVILIDDAMIPTDPFMIKNAKAAITKAIGKLGPRDMTAILFSADTKKTQNFTTDHATLLAALDKFNPGWARWDDSDDFYWMGSVKTLSAVAEYLMAAPGRRKTLIWVSPGVPFDAAKMHPPLPHWEAMSTIFDEMGILFQRAQRANVAIYPIDPTGLGGLEEYIANHLGPPTPAVREAAHRQAVLSFDFVETAAANTGGHAIVNTNDPLPGVDQIFAETGSYYMLGFQPLNTKEDGTLRRLDVKVNRPGVEVHTRSGYSVPKPLAPSAATKALTENAILAKAIGGVLPEADLPLGVTLAPFAIPGQHMAAVAIALGVRQPVPEEAARTKVTETTELQISAFTPQGDPRGTQRSTAHVVLRTGATGDAEYEVLGRIDLAPGRYSLHLAAHNATSRKTGTVAANLIVPDFTNDAFSISGVAVSRTPAKVSAPRDLLAPLLPIVPTADREFATSDTAEAYLQLYQSGKKPFGAASLAIHIENDHGGTDASGTQVVGMERFSAAELPKQIGPPVRGLGPQAGAKSDPFANAGLRAADVRYAIPLSKLSRGEYLLTFEATLGTTTLKRNVRFSVK